MLIGLENFERQSELVLDFHQILTCLLNEEWRGNHVSICQDVQESLERDPEYLS
jgi:hypothetical protein